jgi:hypothetical protein
MTIVMPPPLAELLAEPPPPAFACASRRGDSLVISGQPVPPAGPLSANKSALVALLRAIPDTAGAAT